MSLDELLEAADGVIDTAAALNFLSKRQLHWRVASGRWQRPCRGVLVAHSGPLRESQILRVALLAAGPHAALAGLTAAWLDGFTGFGDKAPASSKPVHLIVPAGFKRRAKPPNSNTVIHYSRILADLDVHPSRQPRRTRIARSLVDAAGWMPTDRGAMAVLAAGVQQRLLQLAGYRTLRFPGWLVRRNPEYVAREILKALRAAEAFPGDR